MEIGYKEKKYSTAYSKRSSKICLLIIAKASIFEKENLYTHLFLCKPCPILNKIFYNRISRKWGICFICLKAKRSVDLPNLSLIFLLSLPVNFSLSFPSLARWERITGTSSNKVKSWLIILTIQTIRWSCSPDHCLVLFNTFINYQGHS